MSYYHLLIYVILLLIPPFPPKKQQNRRFPLPLLATLRIRRYDVWYLARLGWGSAVEVPGVTSFPGKNRRTKEIFLKKKCLVKPQTFVQSIENHHAEIEKKWCWFLKKVPRISTPTSFTSIAMKLCPGHGLQFFSQAWHQQFLHQKRAICPERNHPPCKLGEDPPTLWVYTWPKYATMNMFLAI